MTAGAASARGLSEIEATPEIRHALRPIQGQEIATVQLVLADGRTVRLPDSLAEPLLAAVRDAAGGQHLTVVRRDEEVSPAKAGEMLGLSRQYVDRLIAEGVLPAHRLPNSTHRRIRVADVLALADHRRERQAAITGMVDRMTDAGAEY